MLWSCRYRIVACHTTCLLVSDCFEFVTLACWIPQVELETESDEGDTASQKQTKKPNVPPPVVILACLILLDHNPHPLTSH